jgi:predicted PurR-regulated permease PerM
MTAVCERDTAMSSGLVAAAVSRRSCGNPRINCGLFGRAKLPLRRDRGAAAPPYRAEELTVVTLPGYIAARMSRPSRISFAFLLLILVLTGWLHLGALLLSVLFSYFILAKLNFMKPRAKWLAVAIFLVLLAGIAYALTYFIHATVKALPGIAETAVPAIVQWGADHQVELPFTDLESLKDQASEFVRSQAHNLGAFADVARGATTKFVYLFIGVIVAIGLYLDPTLELDPPAGAARQNLYSLCCEEISRRFATFYRSFDMVTNAQVTVSAINTLLTGIFVEVMGLQHLVVAVGLTFLCGFIPVIGNLVSNTLVVALGFMVSPAKGLWALVFLVLVHKLGYFLTGKVIGAKIKTPIWLMLLALMLGEKLMGITGMVLAPVVLHYIRMEASKISVDAEAR